MQIFFILQIQEGIALVFSREKEGNLFHMMIYEQIPEREGPWPGEIFVSCGELNKSRNFPL